MMASHVHLLLMPNFTSRGVTVQSPETCLRSVDELAAYLQQQGIAHVRRQHEPTLVVRLNSDLEASPRPVLVRWAMGPGIAHFMVHLREVPEHKVGPVAVAIARINAELSLPGLSLDGKNQLFVRISQRVDDAHGLSARACTDLMATCVDTAQQAEANLAVVFSPHANLPETPKMRAET